MTKKETYLTCTNGNIFEGMTSISAIIAKREQNINESRIIHKILFDKSKMKSKSRELSFLRNKSHNHGFEIEFVDAEDIDKITTGNTHGGIIALCDVRAIPFLEDSTAKIISDGVYVLLDGIEDPYNFGYSIRSLYAAGVDGVVLSPRNWMNVAGIVAKSSAGTSELLDMYISEPTDAISFFKKQGYKIVCSGIRNSISMYEADMRKPIFLIIGGEKRGISSALEKQADVIARIEYGRVFRGSLSAASAATIMAYEILRQNR